MKITLHPLLSDATIEATVNGDVITINGEVLDFGPLKEGFNLPGAAVSSAMVVDAYLITRTNGNININLHLPVTTGTAEEIKNPPQPVVIDLKKGVVPFPDTSAPVKDDVFVPQNDSEEKQND